MPKDSLLDQIEPLTRRIKFHFAILLSQGLPKDQLSLLVILDNLEKYAKKPKKKEEATNFLEVAKIESEQLIEGVKNNNLSILRENIQKVVSGPQPKTPWQDPQPVGEEKTPLANARGIYNALFEIKKLLQL